MVRIFSALRIFGVIVIGGSVTMMRYAAIRSPQTLIPYIEAEHSSLEIECNMISPEKRRMKASVSISKILYFFIFDPAIEFLMPYIYSNFSYIFYGAQISVTGHLISNKSINF